MKRSENYNRLIRDIASLKTVPIDEVENLRKSFSKNRELIINSFMRYAVQLANEYAFKNPTVNRDEIVQSALEGLTLGVNLAQTCSDVSLVSLIACHIRSQIRWYLEHYKYADYVDFDYEYKGEKVTRLKSLDEPLSQDNDEPVYSSIASDSSSDFTESSKQNIKKLLMTTLSSFDYNIWCAYLDIDDNFACAKTVSDIAQDFGVTSNCIWYRIASTRPLLYNALSKYGIDISVSYPEFKRHRRSKRLKRNAA